jgi:hypothetical protein
VKTQNLCQLEGQDFSHIHAQELDTASIENSLEAIQTDAQGSANVDIIVFFVLIKKTIGVYILQSCCGPKIWLSVHLFD